MKRELRLKVTVALVWNKGRRRRGRVDQCPVDNMVWGACRLQAGCGALDVARDEKKSALSSGFLAPIESLQKQPWPVSVVPLALFLF